MNIIMNEDGWIIYLYEIQAKQIWQSVRSHFLMHRNNREGKSDMKNKRLSDLLCICFFFLLIMNKLQVAGCSCAPVLTGTIMQQVTWLSLISFWSPFRLSTSHRLHFNCPSIVLCHTFFFSFYQQLNTINLNFPIIISALIPHKWK